MKKIAENTNGVQRNGLGLNDAFFPTIMTSNSRCVISTVRAIALLICWLIVSRIAGAGSEWSHKYDQEKPIKGERDYILRIFDFYSQIRENFDASGYAGRSRDLLEDYSTAMLIPACSSCAKLLSRGHDTELMAAYFRLLQFTQDSASESYGWHLASIFVANPSIVENTFRQLTPEQKCIGFAQLSWGFANVTYDKKAAPATKRLEERLTRMRPSCE